jgi:hypothetical protein
MTTSKVEQCPYPDKFCPILMPFSDRIMDRKEGKIPRVGIADESRNALKMAFNDVATQ